VGRSEVQIVRTGSPCSKIFPVDLRTWKYITVRMEPATAFISIYHWHIAHLMAYGGPCFRIEQHRCDLSASTIQAFSTTYATPSWDIFTITLMIHFVTYSVPSGLATRDPSLFTVDPQNTKVMNTHDCAISMPSVPHQSSPLRPRVPTSLYPVSWEFSEDHRA